MLYGGLNALTAWSLQLSVTVRGSYAGQLSVFSACQPKVATVSYSR